MKNRERAVDEFLSSVLSGETTVEALRRDRPALGEEVFRLLETAERVWLAEYSPASVIQLEAGRNRLIERVEALESTRPNSPFNWLWALGASKLARVAAAVSFAILLGAAGVTVAAAKSAPDSALYGYRLWLEDARVSLSPESARFSLYMDLADERIGQAISAAKRGAGNETERAATAYENAVQHAGTELAKLRQAPDAKNVDAVEARYENDLKNHGDALEESSLVAPQPAAERLRVEAQRVKEKLRSEIAPAGGGNVPSGRPESPASPAPRPITPATGKPNVEPPGLNSTARPTPPHPTATRPTPGRISTPLPTSTPGDLTGDDVGDAQLETTSMAPTGSAETTTLSPTPTPSIATEAPLRVPSVEVPKVVSPDALPALAATRQQGVEELTTATANGGNVNLGAGTGKQQDGKPTKSTSVPYRRPARDRD